MAKQKGNMLTGVLGPLVYRIVNGKQIVSQRIKKGTMKQTQNTKNVSKTFGVAAQFASNIRESLIVQLSGYYDVGMRNRFNGVMVKILNESKDSKSKRYHFETDSFQRLEEFDFNLESPVADYTRVKPSLALVDSQLVISLPSLNNPGLFKFPEEAIRCDLVFTLSILRYDQGSMVALADTQSITLFKNELPDSVSQFTFDVPQGCLYVVGMFMEYFKADRSGWKLIKNNDFNPGKIISAGLSTDTTSVSDKWLWRKMVKLP